MPRLAATAILAALLLAGCSHNQSLSPEGLKSDATELLSIAAEAELFANFVSHGQSTDAYVQGHPEYLRQQLKDLRKDLEKKNVDPSLQNALATLQKLSSQLAGAFTGIPATPRDPRWAELATNFARIAQAARDLRRAP